MVEVLVFKRSLKKGREEMQVNMVKKLASKLSSKEISRLTVLPLSKITSKI